MKKIIKPILASAFFTASAIGTISTAEAATLMEGVKIATTLVQVMPNVNPSYDKAVCDAGGIRVIARGQHANDVWMRFPNGATISDPIHDGKGYSCNADLVSNGSNLAAVRYGTRRDVHNLYALTNTGEVKKLNIRIHDGRQHVISMHGDEYHINYGVNHDLFRIVKFDGQNFKVTRWR